MRLRSVTDGLGTPCVVGIGLLAALTGCSSSGSSNKSGMAPPASGGGTEVSKNQPAPVLGNCMPGDTTACSSVTADTGQTIQLGQYGAQMDNNAGQGFENTVASSDVPPQPSSTCQSFANLFNEDPKLTADLLQTTKNGITIDFSLYTVYRPAIWPSGPVPVITWANGTCAQPEGYGPLLRYVASYGYFVIAHNSRQASSGTPLPMLRALDFAAAANMDSSSPYYQHLDLTKVGAMGHSQGGGTVVTASSDSRIQAVVIFNGGTSASKPILAISGDLDVSMTSPSAMAQAANGAPKGAWAYYHNPVGKGQLRGHLVLMMSPERVDDQATSWFEMLFRNDANATAKFVGSSCGFCGQGSNSANAYEFGEHGLP
jgi:hypothetical protein